jgi:hypothetical protein
MNTQKSINMFKPTALYLSFIGVLLFLVFIDTRIGSLVQILRLTIPYQRYVATGVLGLSIATGLLGAYRHSARSAEPWRVPQSQVLLCFILFFILGLLSVIISH